MACGFVPLTVVWFAVNVIGAAAAAQPSPPDAKLPDAKRADAKRADAAERLDIDYELAQPGQVSLGVYDSTGRQVRALLTGVKQEGGKHSVARDGLDRYGRAQPAGDYAWRMLRTSCSSRTSSTIACASSRRAARSSRRQNQGAAPAAVGPDGRLFVVSADQVVEVGKETGAAKGLIRDSQLKHPVRLANDPANHDLLVAQRAPGAHDVRRYSASDGTLIASYGRPEGRKYGVWDPLDWDGIFEIAADGKGGFVTVKVFPRRVAAPVRWGGSGLMAEYFTNQELKGEPAVTRTDPLLRYGPLKGPFRVIPAQPDWFRATDPAELRSGSFSARWTGFIEAPASEEFIFSAASNVNMCVDSVPSALIAPRISGNHKPRNEPDHRSSCQMKFA